MQTSLSANDLTDTTHDEGAAWVEHYAREWLPRGIVVIAARPNRNWRPGDRVEFHWPRQWGRIQPREAAALLATWRPGYAVALVTGHGIDGIDLDPRDGNGLDVEHEWDRLAAAGVLALGWNQTPSGGAHILVPSTGLAASAAPVVGLDFRGGMIRPPVSGNTHRGLLYLPGTIRPKYRDKPGSHYVARDVIAPALLDDLADYREQSRATVSAYYAGHGITLSDPAHTSARPRPALPVPSMSVERWPGHLPAWLARMFTEPAPVGTRSERWHALVAGCLRAGVPHALMLDLMAAWDEAHGGKYRGRVADQVQASAVKVAATNRGPSRSLTLRAGPSRRGPSRGGPARQLHGQRSGVTQ